MSASTGTIQRPMPGGSILGAIAIGVATLFAVGALAWGAANLTATKHVATPVPAPQYIDRGGRDLPQAAPMPYSPAAGNVGPRQAINETPRFNTQAYVQSILDRNAQNVVVTQRGLGKHAE
jgi:hypothetical protein